MKTDSQLAQLVADALNKLPQMRGHGVEDYTTSGKDGRILQKFATISGTDRGVSATVRGGRLFVSSGTLFAKRQKWDGREVDVGSSEEALESLAASDFAGFIIND